MDDKLREIILQAYSSNSMEEQITKEMAQIKQVFIDEGYDLELKEPFGKGWKNGYQSAEYVCNRSNHMTGQEWYARFVILAKSSGYYSDDLPMMKLAREAAGLNE